MTRYKKYVRETKNISLENDYPWLPYNVGSTSIEGVYCGIKDNKIIVKTYYNTITGIKLIDCNGNIEQDFE